VSGEAVQIRLDWVVSGTTTDISLTGGPLGNEGLSDLLPQDSITLMITGDTVFVLRAMNGSQQVLRTLEVRLRQASSVGPVSPAAYNLSGQVVTNPNPPPSTAIQLTWSYDSENTIIGFRLYRNSGGGFILIAAEDQLNNLARGFLDQSGANCMTYYVVGVYQSANSQWLETTPSNQWSSACP